MVFGTLDFLILTALNKFKTYQDCHKKYFQIFFKGFYFFFEYQTWKNCKKWQKLANNENENFDHNEI